jgi:integrase
MADVSVDKLPSGKWRVRWRVGNKRLSKSFTLKGDAHKHAHEMRRALETGTIDTRDADLQTLAELAGEYMAAKRIELEDKTFYGYRDVWAAHVDARILNKTDRKWHHEIAELPLRAFTPTVIEDWRNERLAEGAGKQSIRKVMVVMQGMCERAIRDKKMQANPVKLVKKPSGKRQGAVLVITPQSVEQIRSGLDEMTDKTMVSLLAYSGIRPGEARALRWEHVGAKSLRIEWGSAPDGKPKRTKTEHERTVRLLEPLAADLKAFKASLGKPSADMLIFDRGGIGWTEDDWRNWRKREFKTAATNAGVNIKRGYDLRHSIASLWLHEGINPVQVAAWLGHNVSETYKTYAHVLAELDPADRTPADQRIIEARSVTHT